MWLDWYDRLNQWVQCVLYVGSALFVGVGVAYWLIRWLT